MCSARNDSYHLHKDCSDVRGRGERGRGGERGEVSWRSLVEVYRCLVRLSSTYHAKNKQTQYIPKKNESAKGSSTKQQNTH